MAKTRRRKPAAEYCCGAGSGCGAPRLSARGEGRLALLADRPSTSRRSQIFRGGGGAVFVQSALGLFDLLIDQPQAGGDGADVGDGGLDRAHATASGCWRRMRSTSANRANAVGLEDAGDRLLVRPRCLRRTGASGRLATAISAQFSSRPAPPCSQCVRRNPHFAHQLPYALATDRTTPPPQHRSHPPRAQEWSRS